MSDRNSSVHWSFWVIGVVALIWNAMGGINFFMQMNAEAVASFPETHRTIIENRPLWVTGTFALAVFGGVLGGLLLLLRKPIAYYFFIASLLGTVIATAHALSLTIDFSLFEISIMIIMPLLMAGFLVWYSKWVKSNGWVS